MVFSSIEEFKKAFTGDQRIAIVCEDVDERYIVTKRLVDDFGYDDGGRLERHIMGRENFEYPSVKYEAGDCICFNCSYHDDSDSISAQYFLDLLDGIEKVTYVEPTRNAVRELYNRG